MRPPVWPRPGSWCLAVRSLSGNGGVSGDPVRRPRRFYSTTMANFFSLTSFCLFVFFFFIPLLSLIRTQSPGSSPSRRSGTAERSGSSTSARPTSASAAPSAAPSPSAASAHQLHHVHHQLLHVGRGLPEPAVHDEDRRPLLRAHAAQLRTPDPAVPPSRLSSPCSAPSRTPTSALLLPTAHLGSDVPATRLQQLPTAAAAPSHAAWPRTSSWYRPPTCRVPASTSCSPSTVSGAAAPAPRHAPEPGRVDEIRARQQLTN